MGYHHVREVTVALSTPLVVETPRAPRTGSRRGANCALARPPAGPGLPCARRTAQRRRVLRAAWRRRAALAGTPWGKPKDRVSHHRTTNPRYSALNVTAVPWMRWDRGVALGYDVSRRCTGCGGAPVVLRGTGPVGCDLGPRGARRAGLGPGGHVGALARCRAPGLAQRRDGPEIRTRDQRWSHLIVSRFHRRRATA